MPIPESLNLSIGNEIGPIRIIDRSPSEILVGESNSHMDFLVSFNLRKESENLYQFIITSHIMVKGWLDCLWFKLLYVIQKAIAKKAWYWITLQGDKKRVLNK